MINLEGQDHVIGGTATFLAVTMPDSWLNYAGKFLFAVVVATVSSLISGYIRSRWSKK